MNPSLSASMGPLAIPSGRLAQGRLRPPPSKSITQRLLNLTLLAREPVSVARPLLAEDTRLFLAALSAVGWEVAESAEEVRMQPATLSRGGTIDCGNNGTMLRFLVAGLSTLPGAWVLDGSQRLRQRTVGPLVSTLRELGARIDYLGEEGYAPVKIAGGTLRGGYADLDARLSSQFASALLMAATRAHEEIVIRLKGLSSAPYLELTQDALESFGARWQRLSPAVYRVAPCALSGGRFAVEGDFSAAAYPAAAALLTAGRVHLQGLRKDSKQGDRRFLDVLEEMGATVDWQADGVVIQGTGQMRAVDVDFSEMPDQVPTLAALAPFAAGTTSIRNVAHLRIKESDRLSAMATELRRLGAEVDEISDGVIVHGSWWRRPVPAGEVQVDTYGDHRVAMSLAICGLRRAGVIVDRPEVVKKSYPSFWHDLEELLRG